MAQSYSDIGTRQAGEESGGSCQLREPACADAAIRVVMERFRAREEQCFWFVHPSVVPADLGERLPRAGCGRSSR
jgi:hypothetical protein